MSTTEQFETLPPLVDGALGILRDLAWNQLAQNFEEPFEITGANSVLQRKLDDGLRYALDCGGQALFNADDELTHLELLVAFARLVKSSADEYAVVALSHPGKTSPLTSLFAKKGGPNHVAIPTNALRQIEVRLGENKLSSAVFIHNHPQGILHDIFGTAVLGPSAQDRDVVTRSYQRWFGTNGLVQSEFYLVENGIFRKFVLPSARDVWRLAQKLGFVKKA